MTPPIRRALFTASAMVLLLGLIANLVGLVKELWVAHRFGVGGELEVFVIGLTLPLFVATLVGSGVGAVAIPAYIRARNELREHTFIREVGWLLSLLLLGLLVMTAIASWFGMPLLASGFEAEKMQKARWLALGLSPLIVLQSLAAFFDGILNARRRYAFSSLSTALIPLGTIAALWLDGADRAWLLALGLYFGYGSKLVLQMLLMKRGAWPHVRVRRASLRVLWIRHRELVRELFALLSSAVILGLMPVIAQVYAATLPEGSVAGFNYANKLISIGLMLLSGVINAVVFPALAEIAATDRFGAVRIGTRWAWLAVFAITGLLLPCYWLLEPVVRMIFERGAFSAQSTQEVAHILRYILPHVPFYIGGLLLARLVVSLNVSRVFLLGNAISLGLYWQACEALVPRLGTAGIGLALTVVYCASFAYLYAAIVRVRK